MSQEVQRLFRAAMARSDEEQRQLVAALVAVDERGTRPFADSWLGEIQRRSAEYDPGGVEPISWSEVEERADQG